MTTTNPRPEGTAALAAAAASGIGFFALGLITPQPEGPPPETATGDQVRDYLQANDAALRTQAVLTVVSITVLLTLAVALARLVRQRLPGSMLADLILGAGVLTCLTAWVSTASDSMTSMLWTTGRVDLASVDDDILRNWYALHSITHFFGDYTMVPTALVLGGFSAAALRARILPRWQALAGLLIATCAMLGTIGVALTFDALAALWFVGLFGWWLWTLTAGTTFALQARRLTRTPVPATSPLTGSTPSPH
jgi:hypothetical protein